MGGTSPDGVDRMDGEVFDPVKREWEPLGVEMANESFDRNTVAVAGGLLTVPAAVGVTRPELYEEETGRWIALPHAMIAKRQGVGLVSVPAAALAATVAH